MRDPAVLLLDEATSALDSRTGRNIQQAVAAARAGSGVTVTVTHRLASLQADCIYLLERGQVLGCLFEAGELKLFIGIK